MFMYWFAARKDKREDFIGQNGAEKLNYLKKSKHEDRQGYAELHWAILQLT